MERVVILIVYGHTFGIIKIINISVEDTAKVLDIDLTDEAFWISALETAKSRIEEFIKLSKEVKPE